MTHSSPDSATFQKRATDWLMECFSMEICRDTIERNHRFLEEALELVQSLGCTKSEAHQLVDYVFDRDQGDVNQEVGGVMVTLAALCFAADKDMHEAGEVELARVWTIMDKIRAKQAAKPKHSPLPSVTRAPAQAAGDPVGYQFRQRSAVGKGPQSSLPWCDWCSIDRETYEKYLREPNKLVQVRQVCAAVPQAAREAALEAAALDFIAKVDRGEARSTKSYAAFKAALALSRPLRQMTDGDGK